MTFASDDGIVVVMSHRISTNEYFRRPESNRPAELAYGFVREPPAPTYGHQSVVGRLYQLLSAHVQERRLGDIVLSPMDVVLDKDADLIVQPDLMFISNERSAIIQNHIWGAPDLVVEVASPNTEHRDRTIKLSWYRKYGVGECWFVYERERKIAIVDCTASRETSFQGAQVIRSEILPQFTATAAECFP